MANNNQYSQYSSGPYQQGPAQESGYSSNYGTPYNQHEQHELQNYPQSGPGGGGAATTTAGAATTTGTTHRDEAYSQQDFLSRVSHVRNEIRSLTQDVSQISTLHQRALAGQDAQSQRQLDDLVGSTQLKNTRIRDAMRELKRDVERTHDGTFNMKKKQYEALAGDFQRELQGYLQEEQAYKERYRDQIARQYRIVNPEASEQEVRQAADTDWGNDGVFQTALRSNRSGQASAVLGAVRARHNELTKIEQSITELAQMFQDLDTLIVQQDFQVRGAEEQTNQTITNLDEGNKHVDKGIKSARSRRKYKWWCLLVVVLIIIAVALGVGLGIYFNNKAKNTTTT